MKRKTFFFTIPILTFLIFALITSQSYAQNVEVSTGGSATNYSTLRAAFNAINAGTHTGAILIEIKSNVTDNQQASLNGSGIGSANYTSVKIVPVGGTRTLQGDFFASNSSDPDDGAIIRLRGADNVTIDGRIGGTGRNLIIKNTNDDQPRQVGIWLSNPTNGSTNGCQNNVIRNCQVSCGIDQSLLQLKTYGILSSGHLMDTTSKGVNHDNNLFLGNRVVRVRLGITLIGISSNLNDNNIVDSNDVGPSAFGSDEIGIVGIYLQHQNNASISHNDVGYVGGQEEFTQGQDDRVGIGVGGVEWDNFPPLTNGSNYKVIGNRIHDIVEERHESAIGILVATTLSGTQTNNIIANNQICRVISNPQNEDAIVGIGHNGNNSGDLIAYNSIYMTGDTDPPNASSTGRTGSGIRVATNTDNNITIVNNSIYVSFTANEPAVKFSCIQMPSAGYNFGAGRMDYNLYFFPTNQHMRVGGLGQTSQYDIMTFKTTLADWQATFTPNQDAHSLFDDPEYDFLDTTCTCTCTLCPLEGSPLLGNADPIPQVTKDIYGEERHEFFPTIGSCEYDQGALPVELVSFNSTVSGRDVTLSWTTAAELNNSGFAIEKLTSGMWQNTGFVTGAGTTTNQNNYTFTERNLNTGRYSYRLKQIDINGNFAYHNLNGEVIVGVPSKFELSQNYPNPFNPTTKINYDLPRDGFVKISVFDLTGKEVASLVNENVSAGYRTITFDASNLSSGIYYYKLETGGITKVMKMALIK